MLSEWVYWFNQSKMKNQDIHIVVEKRRLAFALALLMHILLLLFLLVGVSWQNQPIAPLAVEIWGGMPAELQRQSVPENATETKIPQTTVPTPPAVAEQEAPVTSTIAPDIIEEKIQIQKKAEQKPAKKPPIAKKEGANVPPRTVDKKPPVAKITENKSSRDNPLDIQNILRDAVAGPKEGKATGTSQGSATGQAGGTAKTLGGGRGGALEGYLSQLKQLIRDKTIYIDNGGANPSAVLKIFVLPDGTIRDVHIVRTEGDPAFASARKQALLMLQRLPPLPAEMRFSEQREWTVHTRLRE